MLVLFIIQQRSMKKQHDIPDKNKNRLETIKMRKFELYEK